MSPPRAPNLIEIAIEPREARDRPALLHALADLAAADPASEIRTDDEAAEIVLGGRDEDHVDALRCARGCAGAWLCGSAHRTWPIARRSRNASR